MMKSLRAMFLLGNRIFSFFKKESINLFSRKLPESPKNSRKNKIFSPRSGTGVRRKRGVGGKRRGRRRVTRGVTGKRKGGGGERGVRRRRVTRGVRGKKEEEQEEEEELDATFHCDKWIWSS